MIIIATGVLHYDQVKPEKGLRDLSAKNFQLIFEANTILPALIAKHFIPKLNRDKRVVFAALSARVGSISDNQLGGWYAYRASKAALNMIIKSAAIEVGRRNKQAIIIGLLSSLYHLVTFWVQHLLTDIYFQLDYLWPVLTSMLLWPWVFWLLRRTRRQFSIT